MRATLAQIVMCFLMTAYFVAQSQQQLPLMPMPASVQLGKGQLTITQSFSVAVSGSPDTSLDREVNRFETLLSRQTGIPFRSKTGAVPTLQIHADHARAAV
jgi:hypothetical protein